MARRIAYMLPSCGVLGKARQTAHTDLSTATRLTACKHGERAELPQQWFARDLSNHAPAAGGGALPACGLRRTR